MHTLKILIFFILLCGIVYADDINAVKSTNKELAKSLLLEKEQSVAALQLFTKELNNDAKNNQQAETADDIYWIAACLFQLRKTQQLKSVLLNGKKFAKKYNDAAYVQLSIIEINILIETGSYKECIEPLKKLLSNTTDKNLTNELQLTLGNIYYKMNVLPMSKNLYEKVIHNTQEDIQKAQAYNALASCYFVAANFDTAKMYYEKAYFIYMEKYGAEHSKAAQVNYNLGLIADKMGDYYTSQKKVSDALKVYEAKFGDHHPKTAEAYGMLGSIYMLEDDLQKAIYYSTKERDILEELYGKENPDIIYSYLNCGKIYYYLQDLPKSEQQLQTALDLVEKFYGKDHNLYTQCVVELSKIWIDNKQFSIAGKSLLEIIDRKQKNPDDYLPDVYYQLGDLALHQHNPDKAISFFTLADKLYTRFYGDINMFSIDPLIGISNCYLEKQDFANANKYAQFAQKKTIQKDKVIFPYDHWHCRLQQMICKKELYEHNLLPQQNIKADIAEIKDIIGEAAHIKQTFYSTGSQLYYAEKMTTLNELGIYFLVHFYKTNDTYFSDNLLFFAENNKANLLRNKIVNYTSNEILPPQEQEKSAKIIGKLNYFISLNENETNVPYKINDSILFYQDNYETFTKSIEKKYPKIYALKYGGKSLTAQQIQEKLPDGYTLLEYFNDGQSYYCLSISKDKTAAYLCGNKVMTDSLINKYQTSILNKKMDVITSQKLYQFLLPAALQKNIIISPDGSIAQLSFDALMASNRTHDYLIYHHTVQYTFSAGPYFNSHTSTDNENIIAFYPNFSKSKYAALNSQQEEQILKSFPDYQGFHKSYATKNNFLLKCNDNGVIHLATHLIIDTVSPLQSSLVFQPDSNYLLRIRDIWKLNINAQLVTLAACQSNFGKQQNGEGIQNFAWAFEYAGAHTILSTQWNAADKATSDIISNFYKNLKDGKPKEEALQLAKINYLEKADAVGAQPFFWANFCLFGDKSNIDITPDFLARFWWTPILVLLLGYIGFTAFQKIYRKKPLDIYE